MGETATDTVSKTATTTSPETATETATAEIETEPIQSERPQMDKTEVPENTGKSDRNKYSKPKVCFTENIREEYIETRKTDTKKYVYIFLTGSVLSFLLYKF